MGNYITETVTEMDGVTIPLEGHRVVLAQRKRKRDLHDTLGDDILRYIVELVTNADDSYRRLGLFAPKKKVIEIELTEDTRNGGYILSVTDNAEGMTEEELRKKFSAYAEHNSGDVKNNPRGIFGQGCSDVLRNAADEKRTATIESIKDGMLSKLVYGLTEDQSDWAIYTGSAEMSKAELREVRGRMHIPKNGTKVTFGVPSIVKFGPEEIEKLPKQICSSNYLRYILSSDDTIVYYKKGDEKNRLTFNGYAFDREDEVWNKGFSFNFDGKKMQCELRMYRNDNKKEDGTHVIVRDAEYRVYANTMFDFRLDPTARNLSGELIVKDLYNVCYKWINDPVNPVSFLKDNRTGFDTQKPLYIALNEAIYPIMKEIISENKKDTGSVSLSESRQFSNILKKINKYIDEQLETPIPGGPGGEGSEPVPPVNGIEFANSAITITEGKQYSLKLVINSNLIAPNEKINISCDDSDKISFTPQVVEYRDEEVDKYGIVEKSISIRGLGLTDQNEPAILSAKTKTRISNVSITVTEEEVHYPADGLEFYPQPISLAGTDKHRISLYVDSEIIPVGTTIFIKTDEGLEHAMTKTFSEQCLIGDSSIGLVKVWVSGGEIGKKYNIEATALNKTTSALIAITEEGRRKPQNNGLISDVVIEPCGKDVQAYFDTTTRAIVVNSEHPINRFIMTKMGNVDKRNINLPFNEKKYLNDIISEQIAIVLVKEKDLKKNNVSYDDDSEEFYDKVRQLVQLQKNKIYRLIFSELDAIVESD